MIRMHVGVPIYAWSGPAEALSDLSRVHERKIGMEPGPRWLDDVPDHSPDEDRGLDRQWFLLSFEVSDRDEGERQVQALVEGLRSDGIRVGDEIEILGVRDVARDDPEGLTWHGGERSLSLEAGTSMSFRLLADGEAGVIVIAEGDSSSGGRRATPYVRVSQIIVEQ